MKKLIWLFVIVTSIALSTLLWAEEDTDFVIIFEGDNIVQYIANSKVKESESPGTTAKPDTQTHSSQGTPEGEKPTSVQPVTTPKDGATTPKDGVTRPTEGQTNNESSSTSETAGGDTLRHPLNRANYAYPILFGVKSDSGSNDYYERPLTFNDAQECHLELKDGETYRIYFKNNTPEAVCVRVLVDGLNTLSQEVNGVYQFAPCLSLDKARHYVVNGNEFVMIQGFFGEGEYLSETDKKQLNDLGQEMTKGQFYRPFIVSRSDDSLAKRKGHDEEIGTISIGVYRYEKKQEQNSTQKKRGRTRGRNSRLGTSYGEATTSNVEYAESSEVGKQLDVYNIFY